MESVESRRCNSYAALKLCDCVAAEEQRLPLLQLTYPEDKSAVFPLVPKHQLDIAHSHSAAQLEATMAIHGWYSTD